MRSNHLLTQWLVSGPASFVGPVVQIEQRGGSGSSGQIVELTWRHGCFSAGDPGMSQWWGYRPPIPLPSAAFRILQRPRTFASITPESISYMSMPVQLYANILKCKL